MRKGLLYWLVSALIAAGSGGCDWIRTPDGLEGVAEQAYTFVGVAEQVELGPDYQVGPRPTAISSGSAGGGDFFVGPADIELHDGTRLTVPERTPGGNYCEELYDPGSMDIRPGEFVEKWDEIQDIYKPNDCVLIGSADSNGMVAWFQVLSQQHPETGLILVGHVAEVAGDTVLVAPSGYRFTIADSVAMRCDSEAYASIADMIAHRGGLQEALIDPRTAELVELNCIYAD